MLVFPDTNVLYRIRLADLLLRSCAMHLFTLAWSDELLSELSRVLSEKKVDVLITENLSDFPASDVGEQCEVCTPDEFFSRLIRKYPLEMNLIIREIIEQLIRPRLTLEELRQQYANSGLLEFARLIA